MRHDGESYPDFFVHTIDLATITPLAKAWTILHSLDDDSLEFHENGEALSKEMRIPLVTTSGHKHFCRLDDAEKVFQTLKGITSTLE